MRRLLFLLLLLPAGLCAQGQTLPTKVARTPPVLTQGQSAQIWADSSGHLHIKCDSGCSAMSLTGLSADTLGYLWHVLDSLNLRYGNKHLGAVAIDTTKGCLATPNGCDLHVYADTAKIPATDSLNLRAQKSGNELYMKCDSGCSAMSLTGLSADTLGYLWHVLDSLNLRYGNKHLGAVAIDTTKGCLATPNGCDLHVYADTAKIPATDSLNLRAQKSGNELYIKCDSGCGSGGGGGNPTGGYLNGIGKDTIAAPLLNGKVAVADSITSVPLTTGGYIGLDSIIAGHCLASPNGCDLHAYVDTLGHVRDSLNASVNVKNLPALVAGSAKIGAVGDSLYSIASGVTLPTVTTVGTVTTVTLAKQVDSMNLLDSATTLHHLHQLDSATVIGTVHNDSVYWVNPADSILGLLHTVDTVQSDEVRAADTTISSVGGKSAADSITIPAYGAGQYVYVTNLMWQETDTLAITGSTYDSLTTTNFPGGTLQWIGGNACAVGATCNANNWQFANPVRVLASNTATKFRLSAPGAGGYWVVKVVYYHQAR